MKKILVAAVALLAAACASEHLPAMHLATSTPSAEVDALVEAFYGSAPISLVEFRARAEAILARHPDDGRAHEVAALAASLAGDNDGVSQHLFAAAADLRSDATELYLSELADLSHAETPAWRRLLETLRAHHPKPSVRASATFHLALQAEREGRFDEAQRLAAELGFMRDWALVGALENDQGKGFLTEYPPEKSVDLHAEIPGPLVPLHWRTVAANRTGRLNLDNLVWPNQSVLAYVVTWVHSDGDQTVQLRLSTSDAVRAWCNDGLVLEEELIARGNFDNAIATIHLHRGWNKILVKSANRGGAWWLRARLTSDDGAALAQLQYATTPEPYTPSPGNGDVGAKNPDAVGGPENRRRFILASLLERDGRNRPALSAFQDFLADAPKNLLATYFGALSYWDNHELGHAIDLLDAGAAASNGAGVAFLIKRARYFSQQHLVEKAQTDLLAAVARAPAGRWAQLELASLYAQRGWSVDACRVLDALLTTHPKLASAELQRAECAEALGYDGDARRRYEHLVREAPGDREAHEKLLLLAWERTDFAAVAREQQALHRLDPESIDYVVGAGDLAHRRGDLAAAHRSYELAAHMLPEAPRPWERLANLAYETGRRDEALTDWKAEHDRDPNNAAVAQRLEFLQPTKLGIVEGFIPDDAAIAQALQMKPHKTPGSMSALLLDHEVTEVHADGSSQSVVTTVQVAFNDEGRDALTHQDLSRMGSIKLLRAYSLNEKGERQEAASIRGGDVRFRNLQAGSRVVLQFVLYQSAPHFLPGEYVSQWYFQSINEQHEGSRWVLIVPSAKKLHVQTIGPVTTEKSARDGYNIYSFSAKALAPLVREPAMPSPRDLLAQISVSTVAGWDDYVRWERALLTDAFRTNDKLNALIDGLIAGATSPRDKLDRLYHYVTQEIRYQQDYETTIAGVKPHAASAVIERGYGDCKDKAVLLIQMARRAGIKLRFAILRTMQMGKVRREVPDQQFNHAIVYVPAQAGIDAPFFMDPTSDGLDMGNLRSDDQGAASLVLDPDSGHWDFVDIPYQAADLQFDRHKIRIDIK
ncbi:MAG TPA: transglutaminase domain-containing protein, partial [Polyangia bacterium]